MINKSYLKGVPLLILFLGFIAFFYFRGYHFLRFDSLVIYRAVLLQYVSDHFLLAAFLFVFIYILVVALSVPGATVLTLSSGFLFGFFWGSAFSVIGATLGATIIFYAAKTALHDFFYQRASAQLKKLSDGFKKYAGSYMLFLRLVPVFPFWLVNIVPAFFEVRIRTFVWSTFVGILPGTLVYVWLGSGLGQLLEKNIRPDFHIIFKPVLLFPLLGLALLALLPIGYHFLKQHPFIRRKG